MPKVKANHITINYDQQGTGEPLILIPYLAVDYACYAFQVAEYAKHFTCISIDLRGTGESDKPEGVYSTELFADDVAAFMQAVGIPSAHISGLSLGAATGMWLAAKYPSRVKSLSLHSAWAKTDPFLKTVVEGWQVTAKALGSVPEMIILSIFPWCFTPEKNSHCLPFRARTHGSVSLSVFQFWTRSEDGCGKGKERRTAGALKKAAAFSILATHGPATLTETGP